ncbi:MAG: hypothetical protein MZV65_29720 [Chromatiales bacterium]|nr:hypothetical protein [Chromatiales bacterium]
MRARPIVYAKDRVKPTTCPPTRRLAEPKWKGSICIRSSDNVYNQSLVAGHDQPSRRGHDRSLGQGPGRQFRPAAARAATATRSRPPPPASAM